MKRLTFLTAIFGIGAAKAQNVQNYFSGRSADYPRIEPRTGDRMRRVTAWYGAPRNGECPVCGTMAEPFRPAASFRFEVETVIGGFGEKWERWVPVPDVDKSHFKRTVTCAHCRVRFEQDAEK